ncbi:hypothetical protein M8S87_11060, partial [Enterobacter roggenkampii]|nr:hypothetical protein [Enterobacter roggenkampii]
ADRNRSHGSTSKTPSYTKSVSWQHHPLTELFKQALKEQAQDYSQGKIPAPPVDETQDNTQADALHKESSRSPLSKKGDRLE